jgi:hypothetical protein
MGMQCMLMLIMMLTLMLMSVKLMSVGVQHQLLLSSRKPRLRQRMGHRKRRRLKDVKEVTQTGSAEPHEHEVSTCNSILQSILKSLIWSDESKIEVRYHKTILCICT